MNGSWLHGSMRWAGYSEAVRLDKGLMAGQTAQVGLDDHQIKISSKDQHARGRAVQEGLVQFETAGVHGVCIIAQLLPYVDIYISRQQAVLGAHQPRSASSGSSRSTLGTISVTSSAGQGL
jgi:hypothetical protein